MELHEAHKKLAEAIKTEASVELCADMISTYMHELDNDETPAMALAAAKNIHVLIEQETISIDHELEEEDNGN